VSFTFTFTFTCECGDALAAPTEEELVLAAQEHVADRHPALHVLPSAADVLAMAERADDDSRSCA
jgi:hypothetical protein